MRETSKTISDWAVSVFGDSREDRVLFKRAEKEWKELEELIEKGIHSYKVAEEAADVVICLARLAYKQGYDLFELVDSKMDINRKRKWIKTGLGDGQHVKA